MKIEVDQNKSMVHQKKEQQILQIVKVLSTIKKHPEYKVQTGNSPSNFNQTTCVHNNSAQELTTATTELLSLADQKEHDTPITNDMLHAHLQHVSFAETYEGKDVADEVDRSEVIAQAGNSLQNFN
jgi:hypothetical protein